MTNKEKNIIKTHIYEALCVDTKHNQAIFDKHKGIQIFHDTTLEMIMDKVMKGLQISQKQINTENKTNKNE